MKFSPVIGMLAFIFAACSSQPAKPVSADSAAIVETDSLAFDMDMETGAYVQAIAWYIDSTWKDAAERPDTLFIGKHDQFPDIQLPYTIQNVKVLLLSNEAYEAIAKRRKHSVFINMIGTQKYRRWEFTLITLFDHAVPQHNCYVNFNYNPAVREFTLDTLYFAHPYSN